MALQPRLARHPMAQGFADYASATLDYLPEDIMADVIDEMNERLVNGKKRFHARLQRNMPGLPLPHRQPPHHAHPPPPPPPPPQGTPTSHLPPVARLHRPRPTSAGFSSDYTADGNSPCCTDTNSKLAWQPEVSQWKAGDPTVPMPQGDQGVFDSADSRLMHQTYADYYQQAAQQEMQQQTTPQNPSRRSDSPSPALSLNTRLATALAAAGRSCISAPPSMDTSLLGSMMNTPNMSGNYSFTDYFQAPHPPTWHPPTWQVLLPVP